jgi:hypothetical protein
LLVQGILSELLARVLFVHGKHLMLRILVALVVLLVEYGDHIQALPMVEIGGGLMLTEAGPTLLRDQNL